MQEGSPWLAERIGKWVRKHSGVRIYPGSLLPGCPSSKGHKEHPPKRSYEWLARVLQRQSDLQFPSQRTSYLYSSCMMDCGLRRRAIFANALLFGLLCSNCLSQQGAPPVTALAQVISGLVYIQGEVNNSTPLNVILDSGASVSIVSPPLAETLRLTSTHSSEASGIAKGLDQTVHLSTIANSNGAVRRVRSVFSTNRARSCPSTTLRSRWESAWMRSSEAISSCTIRSPSTMSSSASPSRLPSLELRSLEPPSLCRS